MISGRSERDGNSIQRSSPAASNPDISVEAVSKCETVRREIEKHRRELRLNYDVPIYISITSDVPGYLAQAAMLGVIEAVNASGRKRDIKVFTRPWAEGEHSSPNWYVQTAASRQAKQIDKGYGFQIEGVGLMNLFYEDPYQEDPHWDVFIMNQDLRYLEHTSFVFGLTDFTFPLSVQSVTRFQRGISNLEDQVLAVQRLLRHEVGHMLGLVNRQHHVEEKLGLHCTNICTMRQGLSVQEWLSHAREERNKGIHFCTDCQDDLAGYAITKKSLKDS